MSLTENIKDFALDLGYSRVGITTADGFTDYITELESRKETYAFYREDPRDPLKGAIPRTVFPSAKSIISVVYDYARESFPEPLLHIIGRAYLARAYNPPAHRINGARYQLMRQFLEGNGIRLGQGMFLPERRAGARAGVVTFGKNNFAFADGIGSFIILSSFVVDTELEYDEPTVEVKCPENCMACVKACPTQALFEPLRLNPHRCISFNNWWTQDGRPRVTSYIPPEIREKMGTRVHGCDVCQEVCPRNHKRLKARLPANEYLVKVVGDLSLANLLNMSDELYATRVEPLMYNYIKDKKYFRRNAAIALGNLGDRRFVPDLVHALQDPEELVRTYSAWALGRIGGSRAKRALEKSLMREASESVRQEIDAALS